MSEFGAGIDQENNMLSEMASERRNQIERQQDIEDAYNDTIRSVKSKAREAGRAEIAATETPQQIAEDTAQITQVGERVGAARGVLQDVYKSDKLAYLKGLGRTGEETDLGISRGIAAGRRAGQAVAGARSALFTKVESPPSSAPGTAPAPEASPAPAAAPPEEPSEQIVQPQEDAPAPSSSDAPAQSSSAEGTPAAEGASVDEGATSAATADATKAAGVAGDVADAEEAGGVATKLGRAAGTAAELGSKAGVGLGIVGGGVSLAEDFSGGKFHLSGDNTAEKAGNALSVASGALDTLGLAVPPLAILGGIAGVASAIFDIFGHHEHANKSPEQQAAAVKPPPPPSSIQETAATTSIGQVAAQSGDTLHSVAQTSF